MHASLSKIFRSVQVYFPSMQDYRFKAQRALREMLNKTHEKDFEALTILPRTSNNLFLDIGANRGDAIQSMLMRRPDARVIAFEPNPFLIDKLKNVYTDGDQVELHNVGLGSNIGSFDLYVPFYNNYMFDGLASFIERRAHRALIHRIYGFDPKKLEVKKVNCQVKRLDELNLDPYFIKVDVQGFEYQVLLGAEQTIRRSRPILLIETPDEEEVKFLQSLDYKPFVFVAKSKLVPGMQGLNVFFLHEEMAAGLK